DEIIEHVLFLKFGACIVPFFTIFSASPKVRNSVNSSLLHPYRVGDTKGWGKANIETSITIKDGWVLSVSFKTFLIGDDHGNLCSVLGSIKYLLTLVILRIKIDGR